MLGPFRAAGCLGAIALAVIFAPPARAVSLPSGFQDETVFEELEEPTTLRFASDGRIFVAEKAGKILVYDGLGDTTPTVFADLRTDVYDQGDHGILGMALDPDFPERPYVYVLYTYDHILGEEAPPPKWGQPGRAGDPCEAELEDCPVSGRLVRLTADGDQAVEEVTGGEKAPAQEVLVEDWCQQFASHSVGDLQFGPEGALYASAGEGASFTNPDYGQFGSPKNPCGDPPGEVGDELTPPTARGGSLRAQNTENLDGSVIRVDPETGEGMPGNPMASSLNANQRRIVGLGFRNPFRFAIDPETDEVYLGNVGWNTYEEIDRFAGVPSQAYNSGWPCFEGPGPNPSFESLGLDVCETLYETPGSTGPPFFYYAHEVGVTPEDTCPAENGSAIAGLDFYEGSAFPAAYKGALFFSDPVRECIYVMFPGEDGRPDPSTTTPFLTDGGFYAGIDVQEGPEGDLYYAKLFGDGYTPGSIHRISYSSGNQPPVARLTVDHQWGAAPLTAHFDAGESSDPEGEALTYEWDLDGDGHYDAPISTATATKTFKDSKNHTVAVRVSDGHGASRVARVTVYPGDTPPTPEILAPGESATEAGRASLEWHVGEPIPFEGAAEDSEDGPLAATSLDWDSRLYHCPSACHVHPLQAFPAVSSGVLIAPDHDYPSLIELTLTATDSRGLAARRTIKMYPHPVELTIDSNPPGLSLSAGALTKPAPFGLTAIEGSEITISAPATAESGGMTYTWTGWSDGGARSHTVSAEAGGSYTADYAAEKPDSGAPLQLPEGGPAPVPPPDTFIRRSPGKRTSSPTARFAFSASVPNVYFVCSLDRGPSRPCGASRAYKHLKVGKHVLEVDAVSFQGDPDPTPEIFHWRVVRGNSEAAR